jgi:outer membrane receptor for ferric coprogen and ferric-rhodotorulic acid
MFSALPGEAAEAVRFEISAGNAADALSEFGVQSGLQLLFVKQAVQDYKTRALSGELDAREALRKLLEGTGLTFEFVNDKTVAIRREAPTAADGTASIETVNVFGTLDDPLTVGSKSGQSLRETPKSVTIVTRERIEAQNLASLVEVMNQTTGVTVGNYSPVSNAYFSRGFRVQTIQLDGGAPAYLGGFGSFLTPDTAEFDHVEMLRGVDGMYSGVGEPGGVINLVRKRARAAPAAAVVLSAGSWNSYRGEFDATGALTSDDRLRGRIVGAYENKGYFYKNSESDKRFLFGTIEYDLTPSTLLVAGASHERRREDGYSNRGLPRYSDGSDLRLPRDTSFVPDWSHWYSSSTEVFARVEQTYGHGDGVLKLNVTHLEEESDSDFMYVFGAINPSTRTGALAYASGEDNDSSQDLLDLSASGTFPLFGLSHRYTIGTDYSKVDGSGQRTYALQGYLQYQNTYAAVDIFNFDPSAYPKPARLLSGLYPVNEQSQNGFYATVGIQLAQPLRLTLGGRYGTFRYAQAYQPVAPATGAYGAPTTRRYQDEKFVPSAALTWDFARDWSAYVSYAETFKVQANLLRAPLPGSPLGPITGNGYELGVKGEVLGFLNTSLALYRVLREGQAVQDPAFPVATPSGSGSSCCYIQQQDITSEGLDAEFSGTVLAGWQLFAGYTYNKNKSEGGTASTLYSSGAYYLNRTPRHMLKLWTTWQLPGTLSRWTLNGGVVWQTETSVKGTVTTADGTPNVPFTFRQEGYELLNASVQYRLSEVWSVGLYGDNLLDKTYYRVPSITTTDNYYGMPRSFVLNVRGRW